MINSLYQSKTPPRRTEEDTFKSRDSQGMSVAVGQTA